MKKTIVNIASFLKYILLLNVALLDYPIASTGSKAEELKTKITFLSSECVIVNSNHRRQKNNIFLQKPILKKLSKKVIKNV